MRKVNTKKEFPEDNKEAASVKAVYETEEEAVQAATEQAEKSGVMPTAIMVSSRYGYATGDGMVHGADQAPVETKDIKGPKAPVDDKQEKTASKPVEKPVTKEASKDD